MNKQKVSIGTLYFCQFVLNRGDILHSTMYDMRDCVSEVLVFDQGIKLPSKRF